MGVAKQVLKTAKSVSKSVDKSGAKFARQPKTIVTKAVNSYTNVMWTIVITIFALSFFALVITTAQKNPQRVTALFGIFPAWFKKFVDPFEDRVLPPVQPYKSDKPLQYKPSPLHNNIQPITKNPKSKGI